MKNRHGFTLIELLVVVAIIALLMAILLPSLSKARAQSQRVACASNLHQITLIGLLYAQENQNTFACTSSTTISDWVQSAPFRMLADYSKFPLKALTCPSDRQDVRGGYTYLGIASLYGMNDSTKIRLSYGVNWATSCSGKSTYTNPTYVKTGSYPIPQKIVYVADCSYFAFNDSNAGRVRNRIAFAGAPTKYPEASPFDVFFRTSQPAYARHESGLTNIAFMDGHTESYQHTVAFNLGLYPADSETGLNY